MSDLNQKVCIACEQGAKPLTPPEITPLLNQLTNWQLIDDQLLKKTYSLPNFRSALAFINQVADLAESENHHPDIELHDYKKVTLKLSTHAIGGLSENDFILASKIDQL